MPQSDDLFQYEQMRESGVSPQVIYRHARADGLNTIAALKVIRRLFGFDLVQAKTVMLQAENIANSMEEHLENLRPTIEQFLAEEEAEEKNSEP